MRRIGERLQDLDDWAGINRWNPDPRKVANVCGALFVVVLVTFVVLEVAGHGKAAGLLSGAVAATGALATINYMKARRQDR